MVDQIVLWLSNLVSSLGYPGVMLSMFIESFFVPIPSELIMPFAGFIASQGKMNLIALILLGGLSSYLGSLPFYFLGFLGSEGRVENILKRFGKYLFLSEKDIEKTFRVFEKNGNIFVLVGRVIPIIRSLISIPAGISKMNFLQFSIYTLIGSIAWSGLLATFGYIVGSNWSIVGEFVGKYERIVLLSLVIFIVGFVISKLIKTNK